MQILVILRRFFLIYGPLGQHSSEWSCDLVTLIFDLGGHGACRWRRSSSSVRIHQVWSSWALPFGRYGAQCVSALMGLMNLTSDLETGMWVASKMGNLPSQLTHARPLGSRIIRYATNGWTDKSNAYFPIPHGRERGIRTWIARKSLWFNQSINGLQM